YENGQWTHIKPEEMVTIPADNSIIDSLIPNDFVDIFIDPKDKTHFYATSYGIGLYEFRQNKFYKLYNAENSNIESIFPDKYPSSSFFRYTRLDAMAMDASDNLWFTSMQVPNTLKYLTPNGEIKNFYFSEIEQTATMQSMLIPQKNNTQRWVITFRTEPIVFVFDDNGTLEDRSDDQTRKFTYFIDIDEKTITPDIKFYRSIAEDKNGEIWIGTTKGVIVIKDPKKIFSPDFRCDRIKIPRNDGTNNADYLLDSEQINAIAVDVDNRKWIATESSGVYLISEDGLETIHHFNTENSPLLSNKVISLGINDQTGEVFIGTENGIISYVSDITEPAENFDNIRVYPNPVRPDYTGIVTIRNLKENTNVKILDLAGNAVYETTSLGGTATWDYLNQSKINSGIYWIICTTENRKVYGKTKLLILK
ncbi:MAG: T9SS type A sorting domain-containing protein, partial [Paludibacteraceae bacterium]|nr:T9SS type A sorting domain-containing protein [Paludibacteraceae bacterium]